MRAIDKVAASVCWCIICFRNAW